VVEASSVSEKIMSEKENKRPDVLVDSIEDGSIKAILKQFPEAEIVNEGELYCQCRAKYSFNLHCISCEKPVKVEAARINVCNCEHGHQNCTCGDE
jgi:hypothetical protein